jgi:2,4-dienoyl-CoA reductase-like NADH-dependent reductase (Old Yellow Enzyme family)/thioredoxin reductase
LRLPELPAAQANLLSPGYIGRMVLRNRMVVAAMGVSLAEEDGTCGDRLIAYHAEQAKGGVALIVMGVTGVAWPVGAVMPNQCAISDDRFLPGLRRLTDAVHTHGARIAAQLHHGGLVAGYSAQWGHPLWAPSMPEPFHGDFADAFFPEEMAAFAGSVVPSIRLLTQEDIDRVVCLHAQAAVRAREAGFDGVEVHGAHGYLLSSFLSPSTNKRSDEYGGTLENRARLMIEVVEAVRAAVGPDFPVWCKLDSREVGKEHGISLEDACRVAVLLQGAGVDAIAVSAYHDAGQGKLHSESNIPHQSEFNVPAAAAIKSVLRVPVIASGRIEPAAADARIAAGAFDFLALGRKLLADPELPRKLVAHQARDIRPCIYCYTCVSAAYVREQVRCAVNPETGYEHLRPTPTRPMQKRVAVVGGGPAGMEAARRLSAAGHEVILLEKRDVLGGMLRVASLVYAANERLLDWLCGQILRSGVDVRLKTTATVELLQSLRPDEVILATGAIRVAPPIPGLGLDHVISGDELRNLMLEQTRLGKRIVLIGGDSIGLEIAEFLCDRGRAVEVVEEGPKLGKGLTLVRRMRVLPELRERGVTLHADARDICITPEGVTFADREGTPRKALADNVIVTLGARDDSALSGPVCAAGCSVRVIGDATEVGYIEGAMRTAAEAVAAIDGKVAHSAVVFRS